VFLSNWTDIEGRCRADAELRQYALSYIRGMWEIVPSGSETREQAISRIVNWFVSDAQASDTPFVSFYPNGNTLLDWVVQQMAPRSRKTGRYPGTRLSSPALCTKAGTAAPVASTQLRLPSESAWGYGRQPSTVAEEDDKPVVQPTRVPQMPAATCMFMDDEGVMKPDAELPAYVRSYLSEHAGYYGLTAKDQQELAISNFWMLPDVKACRVNFNPIAGAVTLDAAVEKTVPEKPYLPSGVSQATKVAVQQQGPVQALTTPGPGKEASWFNFDEIAKILSSAMVGYADVQKQQAATQLMLAQQQGKPIYVDPQTQQHAKSNTWLYATIGIVAVGLVGFLLLRD